MMAAVLMADVTDFGSKSWTQASWLPIMVLFGVVFLIGLVFFGWALWLRTPRKRKHSYRHGDDHGGLPERHRRRTGLAKLFHRKRHRSHRRERPVNPTLSQIGGLPPPRDGQPPHS